MAEGKKPTRVEYERRLDIIEELILQGVTSPRTICRYLTSEEFKENFKTEAIRVSTRTIDRYIRDVYKRFIRDNWQDRQDNISLAIKRRERLLKLALNAKDTKTALAVQDSEDKIKGILVDRVDHSGFIAGTLPDVKLTEDDRLHFQELMKYLQGKKGK